MFVLAGDVQKMKLWDTALNQSGKLAFGTLRARTRATRYSAKFQGKKHGLWEVGESKVVPSTWESVNFCRSSQADIQKHVVKVGERDIGTGVLGAFSWINLFDKVMAKLDMKMAFAELQSWDSPGVELWKHLEAISVIGIENGRWEEQCLCGGQSGKVLDT